MSVSDKTHILVDLVNTIASRAQTSDEAKSYTAQLLNAGTEKCARKFGEEAIELILATTRDDKPHLTAEAADVIYHLLVVLQSAGIPFETVLEELTRRSNQSGLQEKAARDDG
ncbi:MAG: phosphoribosyl-ATP diphosphatase [Anderseniella sp.]